MIIGLDVSQTCAERAGCAWYADAMARAIVAAGLPRGHRFELYHHFGSWVNADTRRGTVIDHHYVTSPLRDLSAAAARKFWDGVARGEPLPGKPDVVFSFGYHAPRMPHTRLLYTVHDLAFWVHPEFATDDTRLVCQREVLLALARAAGFLFVSAQTRTEFEQLLPGWLQQTERPQLIAPGASRFPTARAAREPQPATPWLMVGSLEPRKNHATALDAYELYHAHSVQRRPLAIVGGSGWKSAALQIRIEKLKRQGLPVEYVGYVTDAELGTRYANSFALLASSWHEGFGLPVVEAMSAGLPVIASNRASLPEVGGAAARYFAPNDPRALADAMIELESQPGEYSRRSAASLAQAGGFSWAATANSVLEFAERVNSIERPATPAPEASSRSLRTQ